MAELNIPNLNKNSDKYLFKKKLTLRRKSKKKLLIESFFMIVSSFVLVYLNYLIPNKHILFQNLLLNFKKSFFTIWELTNYLYEVFLVLFIIISLTSVIILFFGSILRLLKVLKRKTR